jgi:hypothetical protein
VHDQVVGAGAFGEQTVGPARRVGEGDRDARTRDRAHPGREGERVGLLADLGDPGVTAGCTVSRCLDVAAQPLDPCGRGRQPALLGADQVRQVAAVAAQVTTAGRAGAGREQHPGQGEHERHGQPPPASHAADLRRSTGVPTGYGRAR